MASLPTRLDTDSSTGAKIDGLSGPYLPYGKSGSSRVGNQSPSRASCSPPGRRLRERRARHNVPRKRSPPGRRLRDGSCRERRQSGRSPPARASVECHCFHASTHGQHNPMRPVRSRLLRADGEELRLKMLHDAKLEAARLVFLSACESGLAGVRQLQKARSLYSISLKLSGRSRYWHRLFFLLSRRSCRNQIDALSSNRQSIPAQPRAVISTAWWQGENRRAQSCTHGLGLYGKPPPQNPGRPPAGQRWSRGPGASARSVPSMA